MHTTHINNITITHNGDLCGTSRIFSDESSIDVDMVALGKFIIDEFKTGENSNFIKVVLKESGISNMSIGYKSNEEYGIDNSSSVSIGTKVIKTYECG